MKTAKCKYFNTKSCGVVDKDGSGRVVAQMSSVAEVEEHTQRVVFDGREEEVSGKLLNACVIM